MVQRLGSVSAVEQWTLNNLAATQTWFDDEFSDQLTFVAGGFFIANTASSDPWSNSTESTTFLESFYDWGAAGGFGSINYDVASLWTDRDFDGGTVGVAYVGTVCRTARYNVLMNFTTSTAYLGLMWAHELGHNFSSSHDESGVYVMSPSISPQTTRWSNASVNSINSYYRGQSCLEACPPAGPPVVNARVTGTELCTGSSTTFYDETNSVGTRRSWSFPGGSPGSSTDPSVSVSYATPGTYTASLTVSNEEGSDQTTFKIRVGDDNEAATQVVYSEDFEDEDFDIFVDNPNGDATWFVYTTSGNGGARAATIDNYTANTGRSDALLLPALDLSTTAAATLSFEYAYRSSSATRSDRLEVAVRLPNGREDVLWVGEDNGKGNFVTGPPLSTPFVPSSSSDWCMMGPTCVEVDLSAYAGVAGVVVAITNVNRFGNYLYVDNLSVSTGCAQSVVLPVEWLTFRAEAREKGSVDLAWTVNQDEHHAGFRIERSTDAAPEWTPVGYQPTTGGVREAVEYGFVDYEARPGQTYHYRLRQQDHDGREDFSEIRTVTTGFPTSSTAYPNPVRDRVTVRAGFAEGRASVFSLSGQLLFEQPLQSGFAEFSLGELPPGVYLLRLRGQAGEEEVLRLVH